MTKKDGAEVSRREFLCGTGVLAGAACLGLSARAIAAAATHAHAMMALAPTERGFSFLTAAQARDVAAIAAQIVPSGATPGATEAGVVHFVDHVYQGLYATRADEFRAGLVAFANEFEARHPGTAQFADLDPEQQTAYLRGIETTPFFGTMRMLTVLGLLSLPSYGGNHDKLGWRLVGFEDRAVWEPPFGYYDRDYRGFLPYAPAKPAKP
jgi:gluconate 2-dehydrogenase gamma chain